MNMCIQNKVRRNYRKFFKRKKFCKVLGAGSNVGHLEALPKEGGGGELIGERPPCGGHLQDRAWPGRRLDC